MSKPKMSVRRTGVARLIENKFEMVNVVAAAQGIPDTLQSMAENLAKIEPNDLMPMYDSMKDSLGAQVADRFSSTVTQQVRGLIDAVRAAKTAIDAEVANMSSVAEGGAPATDMTADAAAADVPAAPAPAPAAGAPAPDAMGGAPDLAVGAPDADVPTAPAAPALDMGQAGGAAGRARKESAATRLTPAIRALRESNDPDALILGTFRGLMARGRSVAESAKGTARAFGIDTGDVVAIVKEAKAAAAKRPFPKRAVAEAGMVAAYRAKWNEDTHWFDIVDAKTHKVVAKDVSANRDRAKSLASDYKPGQVIETSPLRPHPRGPEEAVQRHSNEKWTRETLCRARVRADVSMGQITVGSEQDKARARAAIDANPSLRALPIVVRAPTMAEKWDRRNQSAKVYEAKPVPPKSPADMRADQAQQQSQNQGQQKPQGQQPNQGQPSQAPQNQAPIQPGQPNQAPQNQPAQASQSAPNLPGTVLQQAPKGPSVPTSGVKGPAQPRAQNAGSQNSGSTTVSKQSGEPAETLASEQAETPPPGKPGQASPLSKGGNAKPGDVTLFSKGNPLPSPQGTLMGSAPASLGPKQAEKVAEAKRRAATKKKG